MDIVTCMDSNTSKCVLNCDERGEKLSNINLICSFTLFVSFGCILYDKDLHLISYNPLLYLVHHLCVAAMSSLEFLEGVEVVGDLDSISLTEDMDLQHYLTSCNIAVRHAVTAVLLSSASEQDCTDFYFQ